MNVLLTSLSEQTIEEIEALRIKITKPDGTPGVSRSMAAKVAVMKGLAIMKQEYGL